MPQQILDAIRETFGKDVLDRLRSRVGSHMSSEDFEEFVADYCLMAFADLCEEYDIEV